MDRDQQPAEPRGRITDEALEKLYALVGRELRTERFVRFATPDTLRNFVNGIGDLNPLFRDPEYATWTRWGGIVAHPCFPYARHYPGRTRFGLPGVHGFFGGNDWRWFRQVKPGDQIACTERVTGVEEKSSRLSSRLVLTRTETSYFNQRDELVAVAEGWSTRHERDRLKSTADKKEDKQEQPADRPSRHDYPEAQLDEIEHLSGAEESGIRGGEPRYVEDVTAGEALPAIVRGPLSHMDITAYLIGVGRSRGSHGVLLREAKRHPAHYFRQARGAGVEYTGLGHMQASTAKGLGAPGAYDYGPQRISWLATLLTNWMGDLGRLVRLRAELRGFNVIGDTTWLKGTVTSTYQDGDRWLVDCEVWGENQLGERTMPGLATVALPSRTAPRRDGGGS
ncbi:MAG: acyl dehydratase [Micromonosporaceae bacterium]|nr:acyl dehydratase [Micromonosporaceae bacterium]